MLNKKIIIAAIAIMFSFNNAHAQFFKKLMKTVQDVTDVLTDVSKTDANSSSTTTGNNLTNNSTTTTTKDDGTLSISLNAPGFEVKALSGNHNGDVITYEFLIVNKTGKTRGDVITVVEEHMSGYDDYKSFASDDQYNVYKLRNKMSVRINGDVDGPFTLSANVPAKMSITLDHVPNEVQKIPYLSVAFRGLADNTPYGVALLQIKNLPVQ